MHRKSSKVFFGWWIVGASFLIALYAAGIIFYGFTAVFEPIAEDMGWSYTQISLASSLRGLETGLLAPIVGILIDRWGPRRLIFGGAIITALGLILLSLTTTLGMFYGAFALIAVGISACSTQTVLMTAVTTWFRKRLGMASGIAIAGYGFSGLLVPVIVRLIELYGWRVTMAVFALGVLLIILPLSLLFRHKPEQYGYSPDGQAEVLVISGNGLDVPQTVEVEVTAKQAFKSSVFWRMAFAFTCHMTIVNAIVTHVMPYLSSVGVSRASSSLVATAIPLVSIAGRLGLGWLADKFERRLLVTVAFVMMGLGALCFSHASVIDMWLLVPFLAFFGVGYGGINTLRPTMTREYFGRASFGTVFGLLIGITMIGSIVGPPLAGWVYDNWGSYQNIWLAFAGLSVVALISILTISPAKTVAQPVSRPTGDGLLHHGK